MVEFGRALDFNLVHAAFLLFAVHVARRLKNARVGSLCARGVDLLRDGVLNLPVVLDVHDNVLSSLVVQ